MTLMYPPGARRNLSRETKKMIKKENINKIVNYCLTKIKNPTSMKKKIAIHRNNPNTVHFKGDNLVLMDDLRMTQGTNFNLHMY